MSGNNVVCVWVSGGLGVAEWQMKGSGNAQAKVERATGREPGKQTNAHTQADNTRGQHFYEVSSQRPAVSSQQQKTGIITSWALAACRCPRSSPSASLPPIPYYSPALSFTETRRDTVVALTTPSKATHRERERVSLVAHIGSAVRVDSSDVFPADLSFSMWGLWMSKGTFMFSIDRNRSYLNIILNLISQFTK